MPVLITTTTTTTTTAAAAATVAPKLTFEVTYFYLY